MDKGLVSDLVDAVKEGWDEGRAEYLKHTTPITNWSHYFDNFSHSSAQFYKSVEAELQKRQVPDVLVGTVVHHQSTVFSKKAIYLDVRRERFVFEILATPFGTGWFVSSRLFDRRREAKFSDFVFYGLGLLFLIVTLFLLFGPWLAVAILGTVITFAWSLMRLAASESVTMLDERLCRIPGFGRLYETWFHPETYFRLDQRNMYQQVVHRSLMSVLTELSSTKGLRPLSEDESKPTFPDLHRL